MVVCNPTEWNESIKTMKSVKAFEAASLGIIPILMILLPAWNVPLIEIHDQTKTFDIREKHLMQYRSMESVNVYPHL